MNINKQLSEFMGIKEEDYIKWCKLNKKKKYKRESRTEFFKKIQDGKLKRNEKGILVKPQKDSE